MMKKKLFIFLLCMSALLLSSCEVHWFHKSYDVAWWVVAIPTFLIVLITLVLAGTIIASHKYVCPKCGGTFYPNRWQAAFSIHINNDRVFKCPHCGRKGFCKLFKDSEV